MYRVLIGALALAIVLTVAAAAVPTRAHASGHGGYGVYCLKYGDTLYRVAMYHGTTVWALAKANGIYNPNYVKAGRCLVIPMGHQAPGYAHHPPKYGHPHYAVKPCHGYRVMWGDTLYRIGWKFGVSPWAVARANGIANPDYIRAGQCLLIPGGMHYGY
jgi:spore germination protein